MRKMNKNMMNIYPEISCSHCEYKWYPRKEKPKSCPNCKFYIKHRGE